MEDFIFKLLAFIAAIAILVSVHEFGHFWVARRLGVKVLRFSIGFGKPLWRWIGKQDNTEYVIAAIPLGGYVKMLDEREADVDPAERHRAFNQKSLSVRSAVVVAGPLFNFIFAVFAFWFVFMLGETGLRPLVGEVDAGGIAAQAGLQTGDEIVSVNGELTPTWGLVIQELAAASVTDQALVLGVNDRDAMPVERILVAGAIGDLAEIKDLMSHLGLQPERPSVPAVFGKILSGEAADQAGIRSGDRVLSVDGGTVADWMEWVEYVQARPEKTIELTLERDGQPLNVMLVPAALDRADKTIGRIGATNQVVLGMSERYRVEYRLDMVSAFTSAVSRTGEYSILTLKVMWRILTGEASVQNLSGPLTIADAAGKSASYGLVPFLKLLAIISISLGVLNLLPIPVLDGGHLLFFAFEAVKGSPLSENWMIHGQKIGLLLLAGLMSLAFYVDIMRFFG